jgi:ParB family chromosome partitioning protein
MVSILMDVGISSIDPDPEQPRTQFEPTSIKALGKSMADGGLIQPIRVREHPENPFRFLIVTGERRWRAAKSAGLDSIMCIKVDEDADHEEMQLIENIHREDFTPLEEARAYKRLIDKYQLTQTALAKKIQRPRVSVTETLALNNLPDYMIAELDSGAVSIPKSQLILIAKEKKPSLQKKMWLKARDAKLTVGAARAMTKGKKPAVNPAERAIRSLEDVVKKIDGAEQLTADQIKPLAALHRKLGKLLRERQSTPA